MGKDQKIVFTKHSPFFTVDVKTLRRTDGKEYPLDQVTALCRCGKSKNKPYCDGSHEKEGLNEIKDENNVIEDKLRDYYGEDIIVHFNLAVCSHNGACIKGLPEVFNVRKKPWIMADNAPVEKVIETIRKCPSGALSYTVNNITYGEFKEKKEIVIQKNGPLQVGGGIELKDDQNTKPQLKTQYELCRCGLSKNKPFCDGTHKCTRIDEI